MYAFPEMLIPAAKEAGIAVPEDVNNYDKEQFPHWFVYTALQLGAPLSYMGVHIDNAKIIAGIDADKLKTMMWDDSKKLGFDRDYPSP